MNIVSPKPSRAAADSVSAKDRPTREEAEEAVRTLLRWAGDDPAREGLLDTPARVVRSYEEFFSGYHIDPVALLERTFIETASSAVNSPKRLVMVIASTPKVLLEAVGETGPPGGISVANSLTK